MNRKFGRIRLALLIVYTICIVIAAAMVWAGPPAGTLDQSHASVRAVMAVQSAVTPDLMKWPDVLGSAVGLDDAGQPALIVFVNRDGASKADVVRALPPALHGIAVRAELSDTFRAYAGKPGGGGGGVSHRVGQALPIKLGTSGGWRYDLANGYCCGGTLGAHDKNHHLTHVLHSKNPRLCYLLRYYKQCH